MDTRFGVVGGLLVLTVSESLGDDIEYGVVDDLDILLELFLGTDTKQALELPDKRRTLVTQNDHTLRTVESALEVMLFFGVKAVHLDTKTHFSERLNRKAVENLDKVNRLALLAAAIEDIQERSRVLTHAASH